VRTALFKYYPHTDSKRHARHLTTLAGMVAGLVAAGSSHLPKMAQKAPDKTKLESRVKRFSRFIQNERITYERFFMPCARDVVVSLSTNQPLLIVFDASALGRGCAVLMASVIYGKRALPLCWLVKRGKKGHFSAEDHLWLFEQVRTLIPDGTDVIFLGDGEFDSIALQRALDRAGWSYVCRTASSTLTLYFLPCAAPRGRYPSAANRWRSNCTILPLEPTTRVRVFGRRGHPPRETMIS